VSRARTRSFPFGASLVWFSHTVVCAKGPFVRACDWLGTISVWGSHRPRVDRDAVRRDAPNTYRGSTVARSQSRGATIVPGRAQRPRSLPARPSWLVRAPTCRFKGKEILHPWRSQLCGCSRCSGNRARKSLFCHVVGGSFCRVALCSCRLRFPKGSREPLPPSPSRRPSPRGRGRRDGEGGRGGPFCRA